jgi:hypothetical protein
VVVSSVILTSMQRQYRSVLIGCVAICSGLLPGSANAQPAASALHQWAVETELIQPFIPTVRIMQLRITRRVWGPTWSEPSAGLGARSSSDPANAWARGSHDSVDPHGDIVVGVYGRPNINHDVLESISEYMAEVGYRHYFWRGLHAEALLFAGKAWGTNKFDKKHYSTPSLFASTNVGYRLDFLEPGGLYADRAGAVGFYAAAQFGVLTSLGYLGLDVNDIGPRNGKPDWFIQGNLLVGASF